MSSGRRRRRPVWRWVSALVVIVLIAWWWWSGDPDSTPPADDSTETPIVTETSGTAEIVLDPIPNRELPPTRTSDPIESATIEPEVSPTPGAAADAASPLVEPATTPDRTGTTAVEALQRAAQTVNADPARSRHHLTTAWLAGLDGGSRATAIAQARRLALLTMLKCESPESSPFLVARKVAPNESLGLIRQRDSIRLGTTFIAELNELTDPDRIKAGQTLYLPKGDFDAVIDLSSRDLAIFQDTGDRRDLLLVVPIEIGRSGDTPIGDFRVRSPSMQRRHHRIGLEPRRSEDREDPANLGLELVARTGVGAGTGRSIRLDPKDAALVYELLGAREAATVEIRE